MNGFTPVIVQSNETKDVLMLGYMDDVALSRTKRERLLYLWSRSKQKLWKKGATSGNVLMVRKILFDCDKDALLVFVDAENKTVCHLGTKTCFTRELL